LLTMEMGRYFKEISILTLIPLIYSARLIARAL
jgi:hypothetical protein